MTDRSSEQLRFRWASISENRGEIYGFCILWIMLFHGYLCSIQYLPNTQGFRWLGRFMANGNIGCDIFLLISGISLYFSYTREPKALIFYWRRLRRLFLPVLLICLPHWIWMLRQQNLTMWQFIQNVLLIRLYVEGDQQIWFVSLILLCYLLYPLIHEILHQDRRFTNLYACILLAVVMTAILLLFFTQPEYAQTMEIAFPRVPVFIVGCWMAPLVFEKRTSPAHAAWLPLLVFLIGYEVIRSQVLKETPYYRIQYITAAIPLTLILAVVFSTYRLPYTRKILRFLGGISLECYLVHILFIRLYKEGRFLYTYQEGVVRPYIQLLAASVIVAWLISRLEDLILNRIPKAVRKKKTSKNLAP